MVSDIDPSTDGDDALAEECEAIAAEIGALEGRVDTGEPLDLGALAERVERVCLAITALPAPRAKALSQRLPTLIDGFDRLAGRLRDRIAATGGRIESTADSPDRRARAAAAYGRKGRRDR